MNDCFILPKHVEIRIRGDYCILLERNRGYCDVLHPSEAFILSLLDGKIGYHELIYLVSETYRITQTEAQSLVDFVFKKAKGFLSLPSQGETGIRRYDPKTFIFPSSQDGYIYQRPLEAPLALNLVLTRRCNFRCQYCYLGSGLPQVRDLRKDVVLDLVKQARNLGVAVIALSGGEPLLYRDICKVVSTIVSSGMVPFTSTNGSLLDSWMVEHLFDAGLQAIQVSLDVPVAEIHHRLTQTKNTFDLVLSGIRALKSRDIWVRVKSVITPANHLFVADLIDLLAELGVDEIDISLEASGSCQVKRADSLCKLGLTETKLVRDTVESKAREYQHSIIFTNMEMNWRGPQDIIRCGNLCSSFVVHPTGNVSVCEMIDDDRELSYGNVYESSIESIWLGTAHRRILDSTVNSSLIDGDCVACQRLAYCRTGCFNLSKLYKGDFFAKDPRCPGALTMSS